MLDFAERLIAHETSMNNASATKGPMAFAVVEKLRPQLAMLMGSTGFRALLSRALVLARAEVPGLRAMQVNAKGAIEYVQHLNAQAPDARLPEGGEVLLAQLLSLLVAFIGEKLTLQMLRELWPKLPQKDFEIG